MQMKSFYIGMIMLIIAIMLLPITAFAMSAEEKLNENNNHIQQALERLQQDNVDGAKAEYEAYKKTWYEIEEGIKEKSKLMYGEIEEGMGLVAFTFSQSPVQKDRLKQSLENLQEANLTFIAGNYPEDEQALASEEKTVADLVELLTLAINEINDGKIEEARGSIDTFRKSWLNIEGIVLSQSTSVYADVEREMVTAAAYLSENPPQTKQALTSITTMRDELAPLAAKTQYNMFDAVTILLREGLEALLVIVALIAFLNKSDNKQGKRWVWYGVGAGAAISVVLGVIVQVLFSVGAFGSNNFLIAGLTGIFAAVMLLYMTYWLHSKSSLTAWNQYIREKSTQALAKGSLWSLALLSFLAIFREGTEIVLFLIGMASSISLYDLLMGMGIGALLLAVISYLVVKIGMHIPIRPFFLVSSILVFYLCFKFMGMGVHGLQMADVLPATQAEAIPAVEWLAIYPTVEGIVPQLFLLVMGAGIFIWNKSKDLKLQRQLRINNHKI